MVARKVATFVLLFAAYVGAQFGRAAVVHRAGPDAAEWVSLVATLLLSAALFGVYRASAHWLERRKAPELAPRTMQALLGLMVGIALFSGVFGLLHLLGVAEWRGVSARPEVVGALSAAIGAGVGEELAFRGALFRPLEQSFGTAPALLISAVAFGLLHALNPGATAVSTASIALEAGVLLAVAYALTRNLWFPIGLHVGWNFTEGGIFGVSVSGGEAAKGVVSVSLAGPPLLTGGQFGPEASIVATLVCLGVATVLLVVAVRFGRWLPMRSRRELTNECKAPRARSRSDR